MPRPARTTVTTYVTTYGWMVAMDYRLKRIKAIKTELNDLIDKVLSGEVSAAEASRRIKDYNTQIGLLRHLPMRGGERE